MGMYYAVLAYIAVGALLVVAFDSDGCGEYQGIHAVGFLVLLWPLLLFLALFEDD